MFQARDYSIFLPSPNAEREFRRLRWLDVLVKGLIALLALLCVWNIAELVQLRQISNQDLADVRNITDDLSTRLIWIVALLTALAILIREWLTGFTTMGLLVPASVLFGLVLVPAMMTEIQPALQDQTLRVVMHDCPPKAIVNGTLSSVGRCEPRAINAGEVLLAVSNPADGTFNTIDAVGGGQNTVTYAMSGRGTYTVYFMFRFADMDACAQSTIFPRGGVFSPVNHQCIEHNGAAWKVLPHTTAGNQPSGIHLIQVTVP